jgi:hypothetical protein
MRRQRHSRKDNLSLTHFISPFVKRPLCMTGIDRHGCCPGDRQRTHSGAASGSKKRDAPFHPSPASRFHGRRRRYIVLNEYICIDSRIFDRTYFCRGIDRDLPMFLRRYTAADHPFACPWTVVRLPFSTNPWTSANQGFPASRLSPQEGHGRMHPAWDLDDLQPSVETPARAGSQSQMPPGLCAYGQAVPRRSQDS